MKTVQQLPEGYELIEKLELQKDKKTMILINVMAAVVFIVLSFILNLICPIYEWFDSLQGSEPLINLLIVSLGYIAYIILHEFTHGAAMKYFGGHKVKFGFTGMYAFAGSEEDYFSKKPYLCISLAPVVVWGIVFTVLMILLPRYFWSLGFLQMGNIAGAAGDFFVSWKTLHMPDDIYVRDSGVDMEIYSQSKA